MSTNRTAVRSSHVRSRSRKTPRVCPLSEVEIRISFRNHNSIY